MFVRYISEANTKALKISFPVTFSLYVNGRFHTMEPTPRNSIHSTFKEISFKYIRKKNTAGLLSLSVQHLS